MSAPINVNKKIQEQKKQSIYKLLKDFRRLNVEIVSTRHFREALDKRVFPLNVVGDATIIATTLKIGEKREIYRSSKFEATVELKRVSYTTAILLTGWKGVRNSIKKQKCSHENIK